MDDTKIILFKGRKIRKIIYQKEWWFSVVDVIEVLTESVDAGAYWRKLKQRLKEEGSEVVTFCHDLKLEASDGKEYLTDCANTEGIFRIIQSIPSPKAEPFKRWLAKVGYERMQKIKNLKRENLRDHMNDLELIFTMLGEKATTEIHITNNSQGVNKLKKDAKSGGEIAGNARKQLEKKTGKPVVSKENYLKILESQKKQRKLT